MLLLQGEFTEDAQVSVTELDTPPELAEGQTLLQGWRLSATEPEGVTQGRLRLTEGGKNGILLVRSGDGDWHPVQTETDGSYLVFPLEGTEDALALIQEKNSGWLLPAAAGGLALVLAAVLIGKKMIRKKSGKTGETTKNA